MHLDKLCDKEHGWDKIPDGWEDTHHKYDIKYNSNKVINNSYQVIYVLAGGLDIDGNVHEWVKRRLNAVIKFYKGNRCKIVCFGGGTYHKPPCLNKEGFIIHESTACADYLIFNGVNEKDVMKEWGSYDTIANAFFSLVNFSIPRKWDNILIVTSSFHMPRTMRIFKWIYSLIDASNSIDFYEVNDCDIDDEIISARKKREKNSINNLEKVIQNIDTIDRFHEWFYTEHKAYSCQSDKPRDVHDEKTLNSY